MSPQSQDKEMREYGRGLFSDTTAQYVSPEEPSAFSQLTIKFRAAKNEIKEVTLICNRLRFPMTRTSSDKQFDYYTCTYQLEDSAIRYYFEVAKENKVFCYDVRGAVEKSEEEFCFHIIPGFHTPDWAKGAVFYQIYVDRFYNGDKSNDVLNGEYNYMGQLTQQKADWNAYPSESGIGEFYGGDLAGVLEKMDYLQDLGVEVIYFNPLFVSPSNHKYDIQDYDHIDPHFGKIVHDEGELLHENSQSNKEATRYIDRITNPLNLEASDELFIKVVEEAHRRGMKVILDGVFNHCGSFNKWMDRESIYENVEGASKGAYLTKDSEYQDFFYFKEDKWPHNDSYEGWWDYDTLPKLNYESEKLYGYIMKIARKWVSAPFNADGWRLDVAADVGKSSELNHQFWQDFRKNVKEANPDAIILAEHYGDPSPWMNGKEWDSVMNYDAFMEPITWFLTGMQKHSDEYRENMIGNTKAFWDAMHCYSAKFANSSLNVAMNELSNHDHSRFLTRTSHKVGRITTMGPQAADEGNNKAVMREAVVMQMTWPGAPTIYYGDEVGVSGFTDPDNRRSYPWGAEDMEMLNFHKEAIRIHKTNAELKSGSLIPLYDVHNFLAYGRQKGKESCVVLINNNEKGVTKTIPVWELGIPRRAILTRLLMSDEKGYTDKKKYISVRQGNITVSMPGYCAMILKYKENRIISCILPDTMV